MDSEEQADLGKVGRQCAQACLPCPSDVTSARKLAPKTSGRLVNKELEKNKFRKGPMELLKCFLIKAIKRILSLFVKDLLS